MNITARLIVLGLLLTVILPLRAQYDEKNILLQQIRQLETQRRYERANDVYAELAAKYPNDSDIVEGWVRNLLRLSKTDQADSLLDARKTIMPMDRFASLRVTVDLKQGKASEAERFCRELIGKNPGLINLYQTLATAFLNAGQYDSAIDIYMLARKNVKDDNLFVAELSSAYFYGRQYDLAIPEYLKFLERSPGQFYFVSSQIKAILRDDPGKLSVLRKAGGSVKSPEVAELLAIALVQAGETQEAFGLYLGLPPEKLLAFAEEMFAARNYEIATQAYTAVSSRLSDPAKVADIKIRLARIRMADKQYDEAERLLLEVYRDQTIKSVKYRFLTRANQNSCELLAQLAMMRNRDPEDVLRYLNDAGQYAYNAAELSRIRYENIHYLLILKRYPEALAGINQLSVKTEKGSDSEPISLFYRYLYYSMQDSTRADSLLGDMMLCQPQNDFVNDAIQFSRLKSMLSPELRHLFNDAYCSYQLFHIELALTELDSLASRSKNEEFLLLAGDWAMERGELKQAGELFARSYQGEDAIAYASLQLAKLESDTQLKQGRVVEFLSRNPGTVFSPAFRGMLYRQQGGL